MSAVGLTDRQAQVLEFIRVRIAERGQSPTLEEISRGVGLRSRGRVSVLVKALVERGYVLRPRSGVQRSLALAEQRGAYRITLEAQAELKLLQLARAAGVSAEHFAGRLLAAALSGAKP